MELALLNIGLAVLSRTHSPGLQCTVKNSTKRQKAGDEARRILSILADRTITDDNILTEDNGRPYFSDKGIDFNISHSRDMVAVSLVRGNSIQRTACDIQFINKAMASNHARLKKIAQQFFTVAEVEYIFHKDTGEDDIYNTRFFQIWALKESYIKLRGLSVFDMASIPSFICKETINEASFRFKFYFEQPVQSLLYFYLYKLGSEENQYMLALALEGDQQPEPSFQWFSESVLPISNIVEIKAAPSPIETVKPNT